MDLRHINFCLLLLGLCLHVGCQDIPKIAITYTGQPTYKVGTNATLSCFVEPLNATNQENIKVTWSKTVDQNSVKIGVSSVVPNASFIYLTAPDSLKNRFTTSSARFTDGIATATISGIKISDVSSYACGVEDTVVHISDRATFPVSVYQIPVVFIEEVEVQLDIRPIKDLPPVESEETPSEATNSTSEGVNTTTTTTTTIATTTPATPTDDKTTIAVCNVANSYPKPLKIVFSSSSGHSWTINPEDYDSEFQNEDWSYNVTARLRIKPDADLDGNVISCDAYYMDSKSKRSSNTTSKIVVKHLTQTATITISPTQVNEGQLVTVTCVADGNPAPQIDLEYPSGTQIPYEDAVSFVANRDDEGDYKCIASNDEDIQEAKDSQTLTVKYMDNPKIIGQDIAHQGVDVDLTCEAESNSHIDYKWKKDGVMLDDTGAKLTLRDVDGSSSGTYTCIANGYEKRETSHELTVNVGCEPKIKKTVSGSTINDDAAHVKVICSANGNPECQMEFKPMHPGAELTQKSNEITLTIKEFPKQVSPYQINCSASNEISTNSVSVTIDDERVCCIEPSGGGSSPGVVVAVIIVLLLLIVAGGVCYYCYKKRLSKKPANPSEKPVDDAEAAKLTTPGEENNA